MLFLTLPHDEVMIAQIVLSSGTDVVEIFVYGAHLASWKHKDEELIFMSKKATYEPPKALRGGIPICLPQFGSLGPIGKHGFARNSMWSVYNSAKDTATFEFDSSAGTQGYSHAFRSLYTVSIVGEGKIECSMQVENTDTDNDSPMSMTCALHTYFKVADISQAAVQGVKGLKCIDSLKNCEEFVEENEEVLFKGEVDQYYLETPATLCIVDQGNKRKIEITKDGLNDAVVWNPWVEKTQKMADMDDEEYKEMLCVEAAQVIPPVSLAKGEKWSGKQVLVVVPL